MLRMPMPMPVAPQSLLVKLKRTGTISVMLRVQGLAVP
jgi:hypothetical protein